MAGADRRLIFGRLEAHHDLIRMLPQLLNVLLLCIDSIQYLLSPILRTGLGLLRVLGTPPIMAACRATRSLVLVPRPVVVLPIRGFQLRRLPLLII